MKIIRTDNSVSPAIISSYFYTTTEQVIYNPATTDLRLEFTSGKTVVITHVTQQQYHDLMVAMASNVEFAISG